MSMEIVEPKFYREGEEAGIVEAHLEPGKARLILLAAMERRAESLDAGDDHPVAATLTDKVSGDNHLILEVPHEGAWKQSVPSLLSWYGRRTLLAAMEVEDTNEDRLFAVDKDELIDRGQAALSLADDLEDDWMAYQAARFDSLIGDIDEAA
jgi:hypothetical protein